MTRRLPHVVLAAFLLAAVATGQCGQGGAFGVPRLSLTSDLWDSPSDIVLGQAFPGAGFVVLLDVTSGPTPTPFGTICTGPNALIALNSFDGSAPFVDGNGDAVVPGQIHPALSVLCSPLKLFGKAVMYLNFQDEMIAVCKKR